MEPVARVPGEGVADRLGAERRRVRGPFARENPAVRQAPRQGEGLERDGQAHRFRRDEDRARRPRLAHVRRPARRFRREVAPLPRHVGRAIGRDHPGARGDRTFAAQEDHAREVGKQKRNPARHAVAAIQSQAAFRRGGEFGRGELVSSAPPQNSARSFTRDGRRCDAAWHGDLDAANIASGPRAERRVAEKSPVSKMTTVGFRCKTGKMRARDHPDVSGRTSRRRAADGRGRQKPAPRPGHSRSRRQARAAYHPLIGNRRVNSNYFNGIGRGRNSTGRKALSAWRTSSVPHIDLDCRRIATLADQFHICLAST